MKQQEVFPGTPLATEEEYNPGQNTFVDSDGRICSDSIGFAQTDPLRHEISVLKKAKEAKPIEAGSTVIARVSLVKDKIAMVEMLEAHKDNVKLKILNSFASIPVFNAKDGFVKSMKDVYRIGDIIKAKVTNVTSYSVDLSTKDSYLGVIQAYCIRCRAELHLVGDMLKCVNCSTTQSRKISTDYLLK